MTIQQLHYVITIAKAGSFNKAAEILYIAQPSLTSAIRNLEKEIGITIFHRGGHGVSLTKLFVRGKDLCRDGQAVQHRRI